MKIKTILVPTDFSKNANNAVEYAIELAKRKNAEIILLHVITNVVMGPGTPFQYSKEQNTLAESYSTKQLKTIFEKVELAGVKCEFINVSGYTIELILEYIREKKPDLVIMGAKGSGAIEKVIFGTNTSNVIGQTKCPLIAVPDNALFQPIKNITFCADYNENDKDALEKIIEIGESYDADIALLHVSEEKTLQLNEDEFINKMKHHFPGAKLNFNLVYGKSLVDVLDNYRGKVSSDLLGISTQYRDIASKLS